MEKRQFFIWTAGTWQFQGFIDPLDSVVAGIAQFNQSWVAVHDIGGVYHWYRPDGVRVS